MQLSLQRLRALGCPRWLPWLVLGVAVVASTPGRARAYSSFADYVRPIEEGGGGGRLFSGAPADAYGCEVCHRGAEGAELSVLGLPVDGYVPGQIYEIALHWPVTAPHVALMAELADASGLPAGTSALAPYATWQDGELCQESGFPAADLCRAGASAGCCRELEPGRDACSFPGERSVLWLLDCGSRMARLSWTAPAAGAGDVWLSIGMVTSDVKNDALGDGVSVYRQRLRVAGTSPELTGAVGSCQAVQARASPPSGSVLASLTALALLWALRRRWRVRS